MGLFSFKKAHPEGSPKTEELTVKNDAAEKEHIYEVMVQNLLKESKTSMGFMGKSSLKAAVRMLLPNELPLYAVLTNVSFGDPTAAEPFDGKSMKEKSNGVLIVTADRLLFAAALGTPVSKAQKLAEITAVDDSDVTSVLRSVLRVESADTIWAIDGNKQVLSEFCRNLKSAVEKAKRWA